MAAFRELVFASGFENVSIQGVAARAGIARSTFYEHFSGKEDLLCACLRNSLRLWLTVPPLGTSPPTSAKYSIICGAIDN